MAQISSLAGRSLPTPSSKQLNVTQTPTTATKTPSLAELPEAPSFLVRVLCQLRDFLFFSHTDLLELFSAMACCGWGIWMAVPSIDSFSESQMYSGLLKFLPETAWGVLAIIIGAFQLYGMVSKNVRFRKLGSFSAFLTWSFISLMCLLAKTYSPSLVFISLLTVASALVYLRIGCYYVHRH